ncbi:GNAT family N-acetyltransferase [Alsobacter sp. SYSU M60028]|uniref:GNAT family N-acetyltransferase n=1 Tax=Alsobacter ponti TaxID=2962936 RepID=A0ABT1LHF3_9HYPH|nr:GNAT family N-acetyltransferase [Alsobacter ponti]MCP8940936.1 GNAT family N-acetyltransferase [Alsobacter ponti]
MTGDTARVLAIADGYHDLPPGKLASVVTYLEATRPLPAAPGPAPDGLSLRRLGAGDAELYRDVYRRVGARWLWVSRLSAPLSDIEAVLADPGVEAHALMRDGRAEGLLELDFRQPGEAELVYFGVTDSLIGSGAGRWMMARALEIAWSRPIRRFWLHTCTLDHPGAVAFYRRAGLVPYKLAVEVIDDPRAAGALPADIRPDLPPPA